MTAWEYRTETIDTAGMYKADSGDPQWFDNPEGPRWENINALGAQGWELVSVGNWRGSEATAFFKRMLPERVGVVKA